MSTSYPADLEFDIEDTIDRTAVIAAARQLQLEVIREHGRETAFRVIVTTPKEAYEFGAYTQAHFQKLGGPQLARAARRN